MEKKYLLIAGGESLPLKIIEALKQHNENFEVWGLEHFKSIELSPFIKRNIVFEDIYSSHLTKWLKDSSITHVVFAGSIGRPNIYRIVNIGYKLIKNGYFSKDILKSNKGDDALLRIVVKRFEQDNITVLSVNDILDSHSIMMDLNINIQEYLDRYKKDVDLGFHVLNVLSDFDIGQSIVIQYGRVLGIEGIEGTDGLIQRIGVSLVGNIPNNLKPVFIKTLKKQQIDKADIPVIGLNTIQLLIKYNFAGIAVGEGTIILEKNKIIKLIKQYNIFFYTIKINKNEDAKKQ